MRVWRMVAAIVSLASVSMMPAARARAAGHADQSGVLQRVVCDGFNVEDASGHCVPGPLMRDNNGSRSGPSYGAIAATASTGDFYGYSHGFGSRKEAERSALDDCNASAGKKGSCIVATWFYNECGALAQGKGGNWGADWADTEKLAAEKAMANCHDVDLSGTCHVVKSYCSH